MEFYAVGGSVRELVDAAIRPSTLPLAENTTDPSSGGRPNDRDFVVVGATAEQMRARGFFPIGKAFPVFIHPQRAGEYALARTEQATGLRHTDFATCSSPEITLEQDAQRRDFTVNALYLPVKGAPDISAVIDPTGRGIRDCRERILRHIGPAFREDPLRVIRCARLAAQVGYQVAPETSELLGQMVAEGMLDHLSRERIDNEFLRALSAGYDSRRFFEVMQECGALAVLYPEIAAYYDCVEPLKYHATGTTGGHILAALDIARAEHAPVKTAIVYHDIYKPIAYERKRREGRHVAHDDRVADTYLRTCLASKRFPAHVTELCSVALRSHMRLWKVLWGMSTAKWIDTIASITHGFRDDYLVMLDGVLAVCRADALSDRGDGVDQTVLSEQGFAQLAACAHETFEVCARIRARDIEGYADMDHTLLNERLRQRRIEAVRALRSAPMSRESP